MSTGLSYLTGILFLLITVKGNHAAIAERGYIKTEITEVTYKLNIGDLHTKQISESGDSLVIGTIPVAEIGTDTSSVICLKHMNIDDYKDEYRTEILNRTSHTYQMTDTESKPIKVEDFKYFLYIKNDLWSCVQESPPQLKFLRVVNHLLGFKEIRGIKYHDGIQVSTKHYLGKQKTAHIREVKYFWKNNTGTYTVRYLGKLKELPRNSNDHGIPDLASMLYENADCCNRNDMFRELTSTPINGIKVYPSASAGINLIIRYAYHKTTSDTFGDIGSQAVCVQDQGIHPLPKQYQLDFVQVVKHHDKLFKAEILPENKAEYFIPIIQEIWFCETTEKKLFIRVLNEVIGRKSVSTVSIHEGVTDLYAIRLADGEPTIRLREVRYFDAITYSEIKYAGKVKLDAKEIIPPLENNREITYALRDNRLFKLLISCEGYDIRVGERWERRIVDKSKIPIECIIDPTFHYSKSYKMKFRLKVHSVDTIERTTYRLENLNSDKKQQFIIRSGQVSICSDLVTKEHKFLRVFNEMTVLVPVHEVEFHDGMFVFDEFVDKYTKSLRIIEIKYLDLVTKKVIKYEGEVILKGSGSRSPPPSLKDTSAAMKVTPDDIFWKAGHFSNVNVDLMNLTSYIENHPAYSGTMPYKEGGQYEMVFGAPVTSTMGSKTATAECKLSGKPLFLTSSLVNKGTGSKVKEISKPDDNSYFHVVKKRNTWICQLPNVDRFFYQLDDELILKDVLPSNYQNEISTFKWNKGRYSSVNFIMMDDKSYLDVKITNYAQLIVKQWKFVTFEGHVLFDGGEGTARKSGTILFEKEKEKITTRLHYLTKEIDYKVGRDWIYTSELNQKGDSLYIGLKWKELFGNSSTVMNCKRYDGIDGGMFDSFLRTKIRKAPQANDNSNINKKHNQLLFEEYFESMKQEVWLCEDGEQGMLRIVNHFFIKRHMCNKVKELFYHDGVTILLGPHPNQANEVCTEIVEIKYLDPYYEVLRYEGKVQLRDEEDEPLINEITAKKLKRVAKMEVHYLPKGEVYKTPVSDKGWALEIGVENADTVEINQLVCSENKGYMPVHKDQYRPVILINKHSSSHIEQEIMSTDDMHQCFKFTSSMWDCKASNQNEILFTRVVNELTAKEDCNKIATIYHYDGVVIDTHPVLTIREIKFYMGTEKTKTVRVVGFVHLEGSETPHQASTEITASREIDYKLSTRRLQVKQIDRVGPIIEVGSEFKNTFGSHDDAVLCKRDKDHSYNIEYKTQFFSNLKGQDDVDCQLELDDRTTKEYFQIVKQELWKCSKNEKDAFLRVVNVYVALKDISRIFYPDGVVIGTQVYPDNEKTVQIREVKYLEPGSLIPLKYEGKMTLEAIFSDKASNLFQMPSKYQEYKITLLEPSDVNAASVTYWPLDVLRVHALRKEPTNQLLPGIKYQARQAAGLQQRTTTVIEGAHGIKVEVGSKYDAVLKTESGMKCMLDEWNPTNEKKFLTKIKLHFDDEFYELDKDTILEYFNIRSIEVWICVNNDDTMLRVVTRLTGIKEIYMVIKHDGVEFNSITLPKNGKSVDITEYKYLDARDFKVLKYEGELKMIKRVEKAVSSKLATQQPTGITPPNRSSVFSMLTSWLGSVCS